MPACWHEHFSCSYEKFAYRNRGIRFHLFTIIKYFQKVGLICTSGKNKNKRKDNIGSVGAFYALREVKILEEYKKTVHLHKT